MQIFGAFVVLLSVSFFAFACYAAYQAPKWSGKPRQVSHVHPLSLRELSWIEMLLHA